MPKWPQFRGRSPQPSPPLDRLALEQLTKAGGDPIKPTETVHYLYLPTEAAARVAATELVSAGYSVEVRPAASGPQWLALARIDAVPNEENIALIGRRFEELATRLSGEYDGWEAAVTK